jgi:hypothetical protein
MPLTILFSTAAAARTQSSCHTGDAKKKGKNHLHIRDFTVVPLTNFSIKLLFRGQRATVISQLIERFLPCRFRRTLAFITKDQRR